MLVITPVEEGEDGEGNKGRALTSQRQGAHHYLTLFVSGMCWWGQGTQAWVRLHPFSNASLQPEEQGEAYKKLSIKLRKGSFPCLGSVHPPGQ